jgi:RNA polymerase sigma-70 factor (ECF subfamily)
MKNNHDVSQFEKIMLPHLDAAYNLARWLTRNDHDAEDLVQTAFVRAVRFFDSYQGGNPRAWLLTIVRHTFYTGLRDNRQDEQTFDEDIHSPLPCASGPEQNQNSRDTSRIVNQALEKLPNTFREVLILKELEEMSYKEIADLAGIPIGTVMSRLARARKLLLTYLNGAGSGESHGM